MAVRRKKSEKPRLSPLEVLNVSGPKKAKKAPAAKAGPAVLLDYPQAGETVRPGHYAVRVAAKPELTVEVCVDGGPWQACRESVGYYWYDWAPTPGSHTVVARAKNGGPRWTKSDERSIVVVETPSSN